MTSFSAIPKEIIEYILPFVLPEDLENFAQCCKSVHEQASREKSSNGLSILQEHRLSIRKYSVLNDLEDVGPFLKALAADQLVARYVRKMNFGPLRKDVNVDSWGIQDVLESEEIFHILMRAAKTGEMDEILDTALWNKQIYKPQQRRERINLWACSNTDVAIALLLPLLPNLNSLSFCWSWPEDAQNRDRLVTDPVRTRLEDLGIFIGPVRTKLADLGVLKENWIQCIHSMTDIVRMTAPPCLHSLAIVNPDTSLSPSATCLWSQFRPSPPNTVKELKIRHCDIVDPMFYEYLGSLKGLESFCFRGSTSEPENVNLRSLFAVLPRHHRNTLTKLSFHTYRHETIELIFEEFNVLKELDVDWPMLLPNPYIAGENWACWLPQTLEKLTIHDFGESVMDWTSQFVLKRYRPVVDDLISQKVAGLLRVKEFSFTAELGLFYSEDAHVDLSGFDEVARGFYEECLPVGIRFSFEDYED